MSIRSKKLLRKVEKTVEMARREINYTNQRLDRLECQQSESRKKRKYFSLIGAMVGACAVTLTVACALTTVLPKNLAVNIYKAWETPDELMIVEREIKKKVPMEVLVEKYHEDEEKKFLEKQERELKLKLEKVMQLELEKQRELEKEKELEKQFSGVTHTRVKSEIQKAPKQDTAPTKQDTATRVEIVEEHLEFDEMVSEIRKYAGDSDWILAVAVARCESGNFKHHRGNNIFGFSIAEVPMEFESLEVCIKKFFSIYGGFTVNDVDRMANIYCPINKEHWSNLVNQLIKETNQYAGIS